MFILSNLYVLYYMYYLVYMYILFRVVYCSVDRLSYVFSCFFFHFLALHNLLGGTINDGIIDHNVKTCIVCVPELGNTSDAESSEDFHPSKKVWHDINISVCCRRLYYNAYNSKVSLLTPLFKTLLLLRQPNFGPKHLISLCFYYYYIPYLYSTFFIHWNTFKSALQF